jgi:glycosyltransferase involved in cell wall biosynthesis
MKVLHIVTRIDIGGISSLIYNYYSHIDHQSVHFDIVAIDTGQKQEYHDRFEKLGMHVYYMPENLLKRLLFLIKLIRNEKYDVVHAHIELQSAIYLYIAALCGVKVRVSHAHLSRYNIGVKNIILRFLLNIIVTKRVGASDLSIKAVFGPKYEKSAIVINNAIDVEKFTFDSDIRDRYRAELQISDKLVIGFVGRLSYQKNVNYLIKVFAEFEKKYSNTVLLIIGDGELDAQIKGQLMDINLFSKTILLSARDDVNYLMMAMDVMLLPSFYEGLPLVLVEAQTASLMCIVSDKITRLISITKYINYKGIEESDIDDWVKIILKYAKGYERKSMKDVITKHNFNIECESMKLVDLYSGK